MFGQLDQGSFLLGGGLSAYSNHDEYSGDFFGNKYEIDQLAFSFYPEVGYFIIENLVLGLNAKLTVEGSTSDNNSDYPEQNSNSFEYLLGPYIRYYYPLKPFALFAELNYQLGNRNENYDQSSIDTTGEYYTVVNESSFDVSSSCWRRISSAIAQPRARSSPSIATTPRWSSPCRWTKPTWM